jgi:hypothetical protein
MKFSEKISQTRTRKAEFDGQELLVRVHARPVLEKAMAMVAGGKDEDVAAFLAEQFLNPDGTPALTAEFLLSEDVPLCVVAELAELFVDVNRGTYKKK